MPARTERVEARLAPDERARIRAAAAASHSSVSSFVVAAALEKADAVLAAHRLTVVPTDYFDRLLASLDDPTPISELAHAVEAARDGLAFRRR
jgi:uncharacterized protein (DUF1778 family)